jgi:large subunit ribosomal protein L10
MNKTQKSDEIVSVQASASTTAAAVLIDFAGLTVDTVTTLRREFRKSGVEYKVVKNTLIRHALKDSKYSKLVGKLERRRRAHHVALQG